MKLIRKIYYPCKTFSYVVPSVWWSVSLFEEGGERGSGLLRACTVAQRAVAVNSEIGSVILVKIY